MKRIANFIPTLSGGGAERVVVNLLQAFDRNEVAPILVTGSATGPFADKIASDVEVIDLQTPRMRNAAGPLRDLMNQRRFDLFISHLSHANIATLRAAKRTKNKPTLAVVEHMTMSAYRGQRWRDRLIKPLAKRLYPMADHIVCVSQAAARDLETVLALPKDSVRTIYNPVVSPEIQSLARAPLQHSLNSFPGTLLLGVGRLSEQKDFSTLIQAFAQLYPKIQGEVHLAILGTGEQHTRLTELIRQLELQSMVSLVGFQENPYAWMKRADLFVLSSRWEALPTVLIEAMACGTNIVSTDCPSGPREILATEFLEHLTQVGDPDSLAERIIQALQHSPDKEALQRSANRFSYSQAATAYTNLI